VLVPASSLVCSEPAAASVMSNGDKCTGETAVKNHSHPGLTKIVIFKNKNQKHQFFI